MNLRAWLDGWLAERRTPIPLRQSTWCANGLHDTCDGGTWRARDVRVDCRCPCHLHDVDPAIMSRGLR